MRGMSPKEHRSQKPCPRRLSGASLLATLPISQLSTYRMRPVPLPGHLDIRPWRSTEPVRTDVYVPCSPRSEVKLRYGQQLELKLRLERHENGAEKWLKPLVEDVFHPYDHKNIQSIKPFLAKLVTKCK
ncbi:hypothetical protein GBAR_LOCUS6371 [Geodia barretti]|uniref:Uncharacterized protein n=1 Tax=Geodia barretti TaxID=519541 RepID=A0AA35RDK4_GEOBA|nr:hypothetical protein GBAR_LOCUS6371 [Geodia barretti]